MKIKNQIEKELKVKGNFLVLLDVCAENYSDAVMECIALMLEERKKGVYVAVSRPYGFISKEMQRRGINTDSLLFLDCISVMAGEYGDETCTFVENPAALEEISMHIGLLLDKIESNEKFLIIDSISMLLVYNHLNSIKEFSMVLVNKLRLEKVTGILVILEREVPNDLKQILTAMCDKVIHI